MKIQVQKRLTISSDDMLKSLRKDYPDISLTSVFVINADNSVTFVWRCEEELTPMATRFKD